MENAMTVPTTADEQAQRVGEYAACLCHTWDMAAWVGLSEVGSLPHTPIVDAALVQLSASGGVVSP